MQLKIPISNQCIEKLMNDQMTVMIDLILLIKLLFYIYLLDYICILILQVEHTVTITQRSAVQCSVNLPNCKQYSI